MTKKKKIKTKEEKNVVYSDIKRDEKKNKLNKKEYIDSQTDSSSNSLNYNSQK